MSSGHISKDKRIPLTELAAKISDGASVALGGSFLHRGPFALVRELIRQGRRDMEIIKQSPGYDIDILCRAGVASRARAGIVAMEGNFGLAPYYRKAVETDALTLEEHACASLTAGLRAAAYGVPFQPCGGLQGSAFPALNDWQQIEDPYGSGQSVFVIPAIRPDYAVIHASEVDAAGNVRVYGTSHWDRIMSRAADKVLVVAERCVDTQTFVDTPETTLIPYFMVEAVSICPRGAWPGSNFPDYDIDYPAVEAYLKDNADALQRHLDSAPEVGAETKRSVAHG